MNGTRRRVEENLRPWARGAAITPDTELYRDLGIYGDDLAFDVVLWATREFGMTGDFHLTKYAPGEQTFHPLRGWVCHRLLGMKLRQFKSLTVRDVVAAIEAKHWPD
jgi:hypothetical protein